MPLDSFQQDVLAQALNEALEDGYRPHRVPLSMPPAVILSGERLAQLLGDRSPAPRTAGPPCSDPS